MTLMTPRFGEIGYEATDIVHFEEGLIGFPLCQNFLLVQHKEGSSFRWLQSIEEPALAFLVVDPSAYFEDYAPTASQQICESLQIDEDTPRLVYTIVSIPKGKPEEMTLNLAGPLLINAVTREAKQVVLEDGAYGIRQRVFQEPAKVAA